MLNTRYRVIPIVLFGNGSYEIQKHNWFWGWVFEAFAGSLEDAAKKLEHLGQEPKYYGAKRI